jgi:alanine racemase
MLYTTWHFSSVFSFLSPMRLTSGNGPAQKGVERTAPECREGGDRDRLQRCEARIDLHAITHNVVKLCAATRSDTEICAVVKADGYGHGAVSCGGAALQGGATRLAVSTSAEALEVRAAFLGVPVLVMGPLTTAEMDSAISCGAEVGASEPGTIARLSARGAALGRRVRVHLKFDSGMGRLGASEPRAVFEMFEQADRESSLEIVGLWTHFATADDHSSPFFAEQLARFAPLAAAVKAVRPNLLVHAANSAATLRDPRSHFDMARCGVAIYGMDPFQRDPIAQGLKPALSLHSHLAQVRRFRAGQTAGYARTWTASGNTWVGLVPIGYGDGFRRALSNHAAVLIGGRRRPIVGTISMDSLTVDLGPVCDVKLGEPVVLIGSQGSDSILAEDLARDLGTINYEVTCGLAKRVPRTPSSDL